jgi:RNA polymerase sigma factor (sigma-70 family)
MPTPGTTTPKKQGMTREDFAKEVTKHRPYIIHHLRGKWPPAKWPYPTEADYEDIFQNAVLRCLEDDRYRRFNPALGGLWVWFVWYPVLSKSRYRGSPVLSCGHNYRRSAWRQRRDIRAYWPWFEATTGARLVHRPENGGVVDPDIAIPDTFVEDILRREWVQKGLSRLSEKDRRSIDAYFWEELRGAELAKALGVSEDHAKKPVKRAIEKLRHILPELAGDHPRAPECLQKAA